MTGLVEQSRHRTVRPSVAGLRAPTGTTVRFVLLIALAVGTAATIYWVLLPPGLTAWNRRVDQCQVRSGHYLGQQDALRPGAESTFNSFAECVAEQTSGRLWWLAIALIGMLAVAVLLYRLQPWWRIRRLRLVRLRSADSPELVAYLEALTADAGVWRKPVFLVDPVNPRTGGVAFGHRRRVYVCLDAGLLTLFHTDPVSFRAVVLHELAHVRNRDVPITYFALAVWRAFLLVSLAPLAVTVPWVAWSDGSWRTVFGMSWRIAALVFLVFLSRNALLRMREHHADVRVSAWLGSSDSRVCLPALPRGLPRWSPIWLRRHPTPSARIAALADPATLFRPGIGEYFATGIALQLGFIQLSMPFVATGIRLDIAGLMGSAWGAGIALLMGFAAVREAASAESGGRARSYLAGTGAGMAAGVLLGERLSLFEVGHPMPSVVVLVGAGLLAVGLILLSWWVYWCSCLLHRKSGSRVRVASWSTVTAATLLVGWSCFGSWAFFKGLRAVPTAIGQIGTSIASLVDEAAWTGLDQILASLTWHPVVLTFAGSNPWVPVSLVLLWVVPLLLGPRAGVRSALLAGLLGAAGWLLFDLAVKAAMRGTVALPDRASDGFHLVLSAWELAGTAVAQFLVSAVVVIVLARRAVLAHALFAAATVGLAVTGMLWGFGYLGACVPLTHATATQCPGTTDVAYAATVLGIVTAEGTIAALAGYLVGSAVSEVLRRRAVSRNSVGSNEPRPGRTDRIAVGVVAAVSVVILPWQGSAASTGADPLDLAVTAEDAASDSVDARHVWLRAGGAQHFEAVGLAVGRLAHEISSNAKVRTVRTAAAQLAETVRRAREFPDPPNRKEADIWERALTSLDSCGRMIVDAIDTGTLDFEVLSGALDALDHGTRHLKALKPRW